MSGKGSKRRPQQASDQAMEDAWARIFGPVISPNADTVEKIKEAINGVEFDLEKPLRPENE